MRKILHKLYYEAYSAGQQVGDDQDDMDSPEDIDSALLQIQEELNKMKKEVSGSFDCGNLDDAREYGQQEGRNQVLKEIIERFKGKE